MPHASEQAASEYGRKWRARNQERIRARRARGGAYDFPVAQICRGCGETFVLRARPASTPTGPLSSYCSKDCEKAIRRAAERTRHKLLKYGLTDADYDAMFSAQGGACASCGEPFDLETSGKTPVCIDHCHHTGRVRGLLCTGCNIAAGKMEKRGDVVAMYVARSALDLRDWCLS